MSLCSRSAIFIKFVDESHKADMCTYDFTETDIRRIFNPYLPGGLVHPYQLDESISKSGVW